MNRHTTIDMPAGPPGKFRHPDITAKGERRASVRLKALDTLWFNTGTLCNITCRNCYIESSPTNDRLAYIGLDEVKSFLDEIERLGLATREIGFTGGEPFMNPDLNAMLRLALERGFEVLVLTNALQPMQRRGTAAELLDIARAHQGKLTIRVSLDHHGRELHEEERGAGTFGRALEGIDWLCRNGFDVTIAGRTCWGESEAEARAGYAALFEGRGWAIDAAHPGSLVLFPEMDERAEVPEITVDCWNILHKSPDEVMCASSRMVVKRKGDEKPVVLPCTLLPYDRDFVMGATLAEAVHAEGPMFDAGAVKLCHPHCARFCVLGGASCSA